VQGPGGGDADAGGAAGDEDGLHGTDFMAAGR
jgi:hypothetical protein